MKTRLVWAFLVAVVLFAAVLASLVVHLVTGDAVVTLGPAS